MQIRSVGQNIKNFGSYEGYSYNSYNQNSTENENNKDGGSKLLSIGGLYLASEGINLLSNKVAKLMAKGKEYTTPENVKKVTQSMLKNNNLDVDVYFVNPKNIQLVSLQSGISVNNLKEVAKGENAFYTESLFGKVAVAPTSKPSLIQHELGHAINAKKPFLKLLQKSRRYLPVIPTALIALNYLTKKKNSREETFIEKNAGILGFMAYLPTIIEEGIASIRGIKAAKTTLAGKGINLGVLRKNYILAWLTYLLGGIGLGVASKLSVKTGIPMQ